ncbi:hypothetical protein CEXT_437301 [Caerostris extrusa]|uniref:Uncharacterized protein n=1 Tax=Caerostris extrusa TaxID=172846 RepID=A0AAV4SA40_CAEEX|nr:hypothetical protein CEXT_437301 [Caerostris extrusa]
MHQPIYCKERAAAEIVSQYGVTNQYRYDPETSDFLFPAVHHHLQKFQPSNSEHPPNSSMSITDPRFLPGFYQTFDQMNATMNPKAQLSHASSQMVSSEISRTKEMSNTDFVPTKCTILSNEPDSQTNYIHRTESFPLAPIRCYINSKNCSTFGNSLCRNRESNIFNLYETGNPTYFTDHVLLPNTSAISVQNRESHAAKLSAVKINEDKNKQCTSFSYGIADSASYASSSIQTQQLNFGSGMINSSTQPRALEYSWPVTYSSEIYNARNISTPTTAKESSVD